MTREISRLAERSGVDAQDLYPIRWDDPAPAVELEVDTAAMVRMVDAMHENDTLLPVIPPMAAPGTSGPRQAWVADYLRRAGVAPTAETRPSPTVRHRSVCDHCGELTEFRFGGVYLHPECRTRTRDVRRTVDRSEYR